MKQLFTVSKGFLSIIALSVLLVISSILSYVSINNSSQRPIDSTYVNEEVFVLKHVQQKYIEYCNETVEGEEHSTSVEFQFNSKMHSYRIDENANLYKDGVFYMKFLLNVDGCAYNSYEYSID